MKKCRLISAITLICMLLSLPVSTIALGNNEALREKYEIYKLDLNCLDNYIFLHFYEEEAYGVFVNVNLCKNSHIQSMYKRLKASLKGDEDVQTVYALFEEILYNEVLSRGLTPENMEIFIKSVPESLKKAGVDTQAFESLADKSDVLKKLSETELASIDDLAKVLKNTLGNTASEATEVSFKDLAGCEWAEQAILSFSENGILSGKADGIFAPNDNMKREELAKLLSLAFDLAEGGKTEFSDVDYNAWYGEFVNKVVASGKMQGYGENFGIGDFVTREDLSVICYRILKKTGNMNLETGAASEFKDAEDISAYAKEAVAILSVRGIINGMPDGTFAPKTPANRAMAAKIIYETLHLAKEAK